MVLYIVYRVAAAQAARCTVLVRVMFDLFRFDPLKQLHIAAHEPAKERKVWARLIEWLKYNDLYALPPRYEHDGASV